MTNHLFGGGEHTPNALTAEQQRQYHEEGYYFPIPAFTEAETAGFCTQFLEYYSQNQERLQGLPPREHYQVTIETHLILRWVYRMVSHPDVLGAVRSILGPNLIVWNSQWFTKMPGDKAYVSWHQDATYWGLHPPNVTTAWIALSECVRNNGCLRVIPGTHRGPLLPQNETFAYDNALSRGQEIAVDVDEAQAMDVVLRPGEASLHHIGIVHGSEANRSSIPRIGLAVRFITPEVVQDGTEHPMGLLVCGSDEFGHFELVDPPKDDSVSRANIAMRQEAIRRIRGNIMSKKTV